ncbi:MAG: exopolysaccharide biosynthesis polyprenyl glycosylphosphotransferase [Lachnospiraceae bacterium]|nr:exopolysaccharide biosynthesis polyprenyl glycosylphosphotransferase [Lachnospiraceae bacterium]
MYKRYRQEWTKHLDFIIIEELSLLLAYVIAMWVRFGDLLFEDTMYRELGFILFLIDFVVVLSLNTMHNVLKRGFFAELVETVKNCLSVFAVAVVFMYALKVSSEYSRILLFVTLILHIVISYVTRITWKFILSHSNIRKNSKYSMLAVLDPAIAEETLEKIANNPGDCYKVVGVVFTKRDKRTQVLNIPVVCNIEDASEYVCREWIDSVYIGCEKVNKKLDRFMEDCQQMTVIVHFAVAGVHHMGNHPFGNRIAGETVLTSAARYATPLEYALKRAVDLAGGIVGSIAALVIIAIVGPMIKKQSPGPILYSQERIGKNGKKFKMYKIRSMYMNADEIKADLMEQNRNSDGMMFKLDFDPRVIGNTIDENGNEHRGIGDFIRRRSLDEFPQFFNVLLGQMSLVGTRPPTVDEWEKYKFHHRARLGCKPGLTGIWQTSGRSLITDFEEIVKLDTKYITEWSLSMDLKLILKTARMVIVGDQGAL